MDTLIFGESNLLLPINDTKLLCDNVELYKRICGYDSPTNDRYWTCECKDSYIHPKTTVVCTRCKTDKDSQPDARLIEIIDWINEQYRIAMQFPCPLEREEIRKALIEETRRVLQEQWISRYGQD